MIRCYDRTRQTFDYFSSQISARLGLKDMYVADSQTKLFIEKLDYDIKMLQDFVKSGPHSSVEGRMGLFLEFVREKIDEMSSEYVHLKSDSDYFRFLKYVAVKMIKGNKVNNRWIEYVDITDDKMYSRDISSYLNKAIQSGILVQHKNMIRFRLNSIYQVFISIS